MARRKLLDSGTKSATLTYDPLGRLFEVAAPSGTTRFLYDGDALVAEHDSADTMRQRYVHDNGVDQVPVMKRWPSTQARQSPWRAAGI